MNNLGTTNTARSYVHQFWGFFESIQTCKKLIEVCFKGWSSTCPRAVGPNSCEAQEACIKIEIWGYHVTNSPCMNLQSPEMVFLKGPQVILSGNHFCMENQLLCHIK